MIEIKPVRDVAVILLYNKYGEFLLGRRKEGKFAAGYYVLPGGKREDGESLLQTVKRETLEEIGYTLKRPQLIYECHVDYSIGQIPLHVFAEELEAENLSEAVKARSSDYNRPKFPANEAAELVWVTGHKALSLKLLPIMRAMLDLTPFRRLLPNIGPVDLSVDKDVHI